MTADLYTVAPTIEDGGATLLPWLREMRDEHPVWRDAYGIWHVLRYGDVARVISDPRVFSSDVGRVLPFGQKFTQGNLTRTDPPRHHTLRRLVGAAFTQVGRVTTVETELSGQVIPADVVVGPWLLSATGTNANSPTRTGSTSTAPASTTWPSGTASTSASASYLPGCRAGSRSACCWIATRRSTCPPGCRWIFTAGASSRHATSRYS